MRLFRDRRAVYIVTGALLTTFVVTAGSLLTFALIAPEIEKRKDENNLDIVKGSLEDFNTQLRELIGEEPNKTTIFTMYLPDGDVSVSPQGDSLSYRTRTKVRYNPGGTSWITVRWGARDTLTMDTTLPVDLVSNYEDIKPGRYTVLLNFEEERRYTVNDWTLHKNTTFLATVSSTTSNYYTSSLNESKEGFDINLDGDQDDVWKLYLSDPNEDYIFDTVAVHGSGNTLLAMVTEGDTFELGSTPIMVYRVRERYVVFRYARVRMVVK